MSNGTIVVVYREQCARSGVWGAPTSPHGVRVSDAEVFIESALYGGQWLAVSIDTLKLGVDPKGRRAEAVLCESATHGAARGWRPPPELQAAGMPMVLQTQQRWTAIEEADSTWTVRS